MPERDVEVKVVQKMPAGFKWDDVNAATRVVSEQHTQLLSRVGTISREIEKIIGEENELQGKLDKLKDLEATAEATQQKLIQDTVNQYRDRLATLDKTKQCLFKVIDESGKTTAAIVNTVQDKSLNPTADKKLNKALEVLAGFPEALKSVNAALDEYTSKYQDEHKVSKEVIALVSKDWAKKTDKQLGDESAAKDAEERKQQELQRGDYAEGLKGSMLPFLHESGLLDSERTPLLMESVWHTITQMFTRMKESIENTVKKFNKANVDLERYAADLADARKALESAA